MADGQTISTRPSHKAAKLDKFFLAAVKNRASDLHLKAGQPPKLRMYGQLKDTAPSRWPSRT